MALYLGNSGRLIVNLGGIAYRLNMFAQSTAINNGWLLSSDNYILTDSNEVYLIPKDCTDIVVDSILLSSDCYVLKDSNGVYLIIKESE